MGENPEVALAKAATDPESLTDKELGIVVQWAWYWHDQDMHSNLLRRQGLAVKELEWDLIYKSRANGVYGANPVALAIWEDMKSLCINSDWECIIDVEIQKIDQPTAALEFLERMRAAAKGN